MNPTVPKAELLERERRWKRPAGFASLVAATLIVGATVIQQSASGERPEDTTELLEQYNEHGGALLAGNVVAGLGFLLLCIPLWFLFNAASGRAEAVRRAFIAFAFIGPVLLGLQGVASSVALQEISDKFAEQAPAVEREARADRPQGGDGEQQPAGGGGATTGEDAGGTGTGAEGTETASETAEETETTPGTAEERVDDAREELADDLVSDSGTQTFAIGLLFPGALGMVVGMVYIPLWAMRTGLLTRFWGSLGMALGVSLVLLGPLGQLLMVIWFAALGLMLIGLWPSGTPPAWEEGEAVPWLRPGESPPDRSEDDGTVEGSGREISEPPLPEQPDAPPPGENLGPRPKKRKRRD